MTCNRSFSNADRTENWLSASGRKQDGDSSALVSYQSVLSVVIGMKLRAPSIEMHSSFP